MPITISTPLTDAARGRQGYNVSNIIIDDVEMASEDRSLANNELDRILSELSARSTTSETALDRAVNTLTNTGATSGHSTWGTYTAPSMGVSNINDDLREDLNKQEAEIVKLKAALDTERKYNSAMREEFRELKNQMKLLIEV